MAVAKSLITPSNVDRSAHELLLRLARTATGKTQIVTTNFDRLFESDERDNHLYLPPRLPQLSRSDEFDGIVYLHGRVNDTYTDAEGIGFVYPVLNLGDPTCRKAGQRSSSVKLCATMWSSSLGMPLTITGPLLVGRTPTK